MTRVIKHLFCDPAHPVCGEPTGVETSNNMDVEGGHNPAAAQSAPSTAASTAATPASKAASAATAAAQAQPITSFFQREETSSAAAAGTATGANVVATA